MTKPQELVQSQVMILFFETKKTNNIGILYWSPIPFSPLSRSPAF